MLKRPLLYLVPALAAAFCCAVYLGITVSLPTALLLVALCLAMAGAAVYHDRLFALCGMLAAFCFALGFFTVYTARVVAPLRELQDQSITVDMTLLQDAVVYEENQRALVSVEPGEGVPGRFRMQCYLPLTEEPLYAGDRVRTSVGFYIPRETEGFDRAVYQAANGCFIAGYGGDVLDEVDDSGRNSLRFLPQRIARHCREAIRKTLPEREAGLLTAC